jgi:hypothetical protein
MLNSVIKDGVPFPENIKGRRHRAIADGPSRPLPIALPQQKPWPTPELRFNLLDGFKEAASVGGLFHFFLDRENSPFGLPPISACGSG